ncbi:GntR family transcriptional regulator [Saccharomonospora sp. NPDC006951]
MSERMAGSVTAYDRLAGKIREQILAGELSPGDRLPTEPELSSYYQVSRNTAREALRALASQGLLTVRRGAAGGTFVAIPPPQQISDSLQTSLALLADTAHLPVSSLLEIRDMLEVPAAEMAALRHTDEELAMIRDSLFDPELIEPRNVFASNRDFHAGVLRAAHNPLLEVLAEPVFRVLKRRFLRENASVDFWRQVDIDHREILFCLEVRDQAGAREATRAHLRYLRSTYERIDSDGDDMRPTQD